jgi:siroheme synthase
MGVQRRAVIANELLEGGLSPETAVAVVEWASTNQQRTIRSTLEELPRLDVRSPAVIVVGAVAALELGRVTKFVSSFALSS